MDYSILSQTGQNVFTPVIIGGIILVSVISGFVIFRVSMRRRNRKPFDSAQGKQRNSETEKQGK